jgi:hypothetical protein
MTVFADTFAPIARLNPRDQGNRILKCAIYLKDGANKNVANHYTLNTRSRAAMSQLSASCPFSIT